MSDTRHRQRLLQGSTTLSFLLRGFAKKKNSKNPRLLWNWVGFCLYTLLKVLGYCDLSVLSMSVMGFQNKKFGVGGLSSKNNNKIEFFNFAKPLTVKVPYKNK